MCSTNDPNKRGGTSAITKAGSMVAVQVNTILLPCPSLIADARQHSFLIDRSSGHSCSMPGMDRYWPAGSLDITSSAAKTYVGRAPQLGLATGNPGFENGDECAYIFGTTSGA